MDIKDKNMALIEVLRLQGIRDKAVLKAIGDIPRHLFIPDRYIDEAYENYPLPVGKGQTISQPYTVASMIQALELKKGDNVLEIGTGSGWNAALIAEMIKPGKLYTTEIIPELIKISKENIAKTDLKNIEILAIDGSAGYEKESPYDKIIMTAACPQIPKPLIEQLKEGGIIIAPVGPLDEQEMIKGKKIKGELKTESLGCFRFVPLTGKYGYK